MATIDIMDHVRTRTPLQAYIDGAFASAKQDETERWQRWAGIDPDDEDGPDPNDGANDRILYSLDVQRKVREALLSDEAVQAASARWGELWRSTDLRMKDVNLLRASIEAALDLVFGRADPR